ncbi:MAG: KH domain-containing protein [Verrucomicrobiota bacterium]
MEQPLGTETAPASTPVRPTTPRDPQDVLTQILAGLGIPATITLDTQTGVTRLLITTAEPARLIGKHGQTLSQLQFLVNRILFRHDPNAPRVTLDCDGGGTAAPVQPTDDLLDKCTAAAGSVRRWGDSVLIGPYGTDERRRIEDYFAQDVEIEAISEGGAETAHKKIMLRIRQTPIIAPGQTRR